MTPQALAATHAAAFAGARGWSEAEFSTYLDDAKTLVFGDDLCFAVIRRVGPEAEVLTLATHPDVQGQGRATTLLKDVAQRLEMAGVEEVFLEVSDANIAATALYFSCGFTAFATRHGYYADGTSAICMKLELSPTSAE